MKNRYWSFVCYPESVMPDFKDYLSEMGCVFAVSPLHDKDVNATGEPKKSHWHVLLQFEGPTTYNKVKEQICDKIGATIPKAVISLRGYYRYLCHLDNPEKAQYNVEDIEEYGGFHIDLTVSEKNVIKANICECIAQNNFNEYVDLVDYYREKGVDIDLYLSVGNTNTTEAGDISKRVLTDYEKLINMVANSYMERVFILPQVHTLVWGNKQGV